MILGTRLGRRTYIGCCTRTQHLAVLTSGKGTYCWWHRTQVWLWDHGSDWASRVGEAVSRPFTSLEAYCNRRWWETKDERSATGGE